MTNNNDITFFQNKIIKLINSLVDKKIKNLNKEWHLGTIDSIVNEYKAYVFLDGSTISQLIPTNPDVTFTEGDEVFVHFVNGDQKFKYVPYKRSIEP